MVLDYTVNPLYRLICIRVLSGWVKSLHDMEIIIYSIYIILYNVYKTIACSTSTKNTRHKLDAKI